MPSPRLPTVHPPTSRAASPGARRHASGPRRCAAAAVLASLAALAFAGVPAAPSADGATPARRDAGGPAVYHARTTEAPGVGPPR